MAKDYTEVLTPIPKAQFNLLNKSNFHVNFSLYFQRMVRWGKCGDDKDWKIESDKGFENKRNDTKTDLCDKGNSLLPFSNSLLKKRKEMQDEYIGSLFRQGVRTFTFRAKTATPLITGLGSGHPTETGMILDRNTGVPYIPASSIKGVLRLACAVNLARANEQYANGIVPENDKTLVKFFGSTVQNGENQTRGQLIFFDAFPAKSVRLKLDIMNPHFGKYYSGEHKQPVETESPVPIKFLAVREKIEFVFNCAFMPLKAGETCGKEEIDKLFKTAFEEIGFGGKTAIGYGRFKVLEEK